MPARQPRWVPPRVSGWIRTPLRVHARGLCGIGARDGATSARSRSRQPARVGLGVGFGVAKRTGLDQSLVEGNIPMAEGRRAYEMFDRKEDGELEAAIAAWLETWNQESSSLRLDLRPDQILQNLARYCQRISDPLL